MTALSGSHEAEYCDNLRHAHEEDHEDAPLLPLVGEVACANTEKACHEIRRYGQELRGGILVSKIGNDRWQEERVRVPASKNISIYGIVSGGL